nr:MAG TPA: minor capsid protein [Caudoviricetes sp.]
MADYGHKETDKRLAVMEKRIAKVYADTLAEAKDKLSAVLAEFREFDEKKAQAVADGKLSKKAYTGWRQELLGKEKHLRDMIDVLTEDFTNADKIAMKIVNGEAKDVYALNANYAAYDIEKKANVNLSWTLYDHSTVERLIREEPNLLPLPSVDVPVDKRWNQKHITAAINRGIFLGDPIQDIAKRLVTVASMDLNAAVRSARTATTAAECAGRIDTYKYAQSIGIELEQEWLATLDGRTRHEHRLLDGQRVAVGEAFHVGGASIRYPGDPQAPGYLIYNCRCTMVSAVKGIDQSDAPRASKLGNMSYEDWKAGKEVNSKNKWGTYSGNAQNSVDYSLENGIINIGRSLGAKAKNYDVKLPNREIVHLTEGTSVTHVNIIAGKGRKRKIDIVNVLLDRYPGTQESEWVKAKGVGYIDYDGESYKAELHWYEEPSVGRVEWKVKPDADGNWFIEDDQ